MPSNRKTLPLLCTATLAGALLWGTLGHAQQHPRTYLWGFQNGCESMPEANQFVERQLHQSSPEVWLLRSPQSQPLPAVCSPLKSGSCGAAFAGLCPQAEGQLLGGSIVRGKEVLKFRLWLYDLASGQVAYQDDYCQSCDPTTALLLQSQRLLKEPHFGSAPSPTPSYCGASPATAAPAATSKSPVHLVIYGEGKHKAALYAALKAQIAGRGRAVLPVTLEAKTYSLETLQRIVGSSPDAQVVGVEVGSGPKVGIFVYDGKSEQTADRILDCSDCAQSKESLTARVLPAISALLDRCFGQQCGGAQVSAQALPKEACEPFPEPPCAGLSELLGQVPKATGPRSRAMAPRLDLTTGRTLKALAWGGVAVSAATSLGLFIANATEAGTRTDASGYRIGDTLWYPAWTAAGLTVGMLGLAIPTTLFVNRATESRPAARPGASGATTAPIRCPE